MDFWSTPLGWTLITAGGILLVTVGILYIFAISSLGGDGLIMGGWASNSK